MHIVKQPYTYSIKDTTDILMQDEFHYSRTYDLYAHDLIRDSDTLYRDVVKWCLENLNLGYYIVYDPLDPYNKEPSSVIDYTIRVTLLNEEGAVAFKLRWL